jgi:hypothetical protein
LLGRCQVAPTLFRRHEVTVMQGSGQGSRMTRALRLHAPDPGDFRL